MADPSWERNPIDKLAEEFLERHRRGEAPSVTEYADKYPDLADEIRDLFPALVMMEELKPAAPEATAASAAGARAEGKKLERLGDFRILREVGRGGMGIVYEAEQESLGRRVALKVLPAQALLDPRQQKRFLREARAAARLHHTNIVPVFGVGEHEGLYYYVMQFIQGLGLDQVLRELKCLRKARTMAAPATDPSARRTPGTGTESVSAGNVAQALLTGKFAAPSLPPGASPDGAARSAAAPATLPYTGSSDVPVPAGSSPSLVLPGQSDASSLSESGRHYWQSVARIGVQVAEALEYAHSQGVLHRDIKPSNLLLDNQGTVWVTDFGLAKATAAEGDDLTHTGDIVGTLRYMAPERFQGQSDAAGDVYSLGLTLYEMLILRPAFDETDQKRLIHQVTHEEPPRPRQLNRAIPRDLETIVLKATERDPVRRYRTPGALAEDLQRFLEDKPIRARQVGRGERLWRWCRRNPALATATAVAAAGLVAVTVFAVLFAVAQANNAAQQARSNAALVEEQQQTRAEKERAEKLAADLAAALKETRKQEVLLAVEKGHTLIGQGQLYPGMLWLARGLENAPADAVGLQDSIRTSLAALRSEAPVLRLVVGPPDGIMAAAFSPDGKALLIGDSVQGGKGEARLWDAGTGKPLGPPLPHEHQVWRVAFSPDGKTLLTATGQERAEDEVRRWDAASGRPLGPPLPMPGSVLAVAFSPDGKTFAAGTADLQSRKGEARLWDADTGQPRGQPLPQNGIVYSLAFSPDGKDLVTACSDYQTGKSELRFWDAASGRPLGQPWGLTGVVFSVVFSPDGKTLVTGSGGVQSRKGEVRFWDRASGKPAGEPLPHPGFVLSVAFSPDGRLLLTGCGDYALRKGEARLWEAATGKPVGAPITQQAPVQQVAFSPDGRTLLTAGYSQACYLWEQPTDRLIGPLLAHQEPVAAVAVTPDGALIVTGSGLPKRGAAQRWEASTGKPVGPPLPQPGYVRAVAFSRDGTRLVTGTGYVQEDRGDARVWDPATGKPVGPPLPHQNDVTAVAFSPDGRRILTGSADKTARLWDAATGQPLGEALVHPAQVNGVAFSPDGTTILTGCGQPSYYGKGQARLWDAHTGKPRGAPLEQQGGVTAVAFSPDGRTFATGSDDHLLQLWDAAILKPLGVPFEHPDGVTSAVFSPDGKLILTGCQDKTARIWDVRTGLEVGTGLRHPDAVTSVAFGPDGQTIVTGCKDRLARVWDAATSATGDNARLVRWVEVQSGMELSREGAVRALDEPTRQKRQEELAALGGPLEGRPSQLSWNLKQALLLTDAGDWRSALWQLDRHLREHPEDGLAHALRARVRLEMDRPDLAAADFGRAVELGPPESVLARFRGFAAEALEKKRSARALWYLDRLVDAEPRQAFAWLERGRLRAVQGQWQEAARDLDRGITLDPADHWDWYQAVTIQLYCGDAARYRKLCQGMLDRFGDAAEVTFVERSVKTCLLMPGAVADARRLSRLADHVVRFDPQHRFQAWFDLSKGMAEYRDGRFAGAAAWLEKDPSFTGWMKEVPTQSFLAMAYHRLGRSDRARQALEKARQAHEQMPKPGDESFTAGVLQDWFMCHITYREAASLLDVPHRREAEACLGKQQWSEAVEHLKRLLEADRDFWPDWVARSCAEAELGRRAEADADFARALALAHDDPHPRLQRGRFHAQRDRPDQAAADFARALDLLPDTPDGEAERGAVCRELLASPPVLARVMELRPKHGDLWLTRAVSSAERNEWAKALPDYDRAAELKPADQALRLRRGRCLAELGRWDEAAADYARGLESKPDDAEAWYHAAVVQLAAGKTDTYRSICARMLDQFGKTENARAAARLGFTLVQMPAAPSDLERLLQLGEGGNVLVQGAALYRAGKWEQAVRVLETPAGWTGPSQVWAWLFLAMAHDRLGHAAPARQFLEKAQAWIDAADRKETLYADRFQRVEFHTLRREAEELLKQRLKR
jgi:WD40 repeat protein/tetratricopeptide (TPR) repeat protein